ncbi:LptF/LptG family permease [Gammaproteobacteria bacterium]|jgi:lipopolysaccharide export system permease protein|nr:LptF/LptG family permease [Gammaproteobacteria bacterium]
MYKKNILAIHLNSQIFKGFTAILLILLGLISSSRLVGYFEQALAGSLNPDIIFTILLLRLPDFLSLLIPFAFFLSLLLIVSELYQSNAIYAYFSAGVSRLQLMKYLAPFFFLTLIACSVLSIFIGPYTKVLSKNLIAEQSFETRLASLKPSNLINLDSGNSYLYFDSINESLMRDITFFVSKDASFSLIKADELEISNLSNQMILSFKKGIIYPDLNNSNKMQISFNELSHSIDIDVTANNEFSLSKLLDYKKSSNFIENQWNASIPLMLIALLVLGFVFGRSSPRAGREGSIVTGILIYILYLSLLVAFRESYSGSWNLFYLGFWPVHLVILVMGILLYRLEGRQQIQILMLKQRLKTIAIIFIIFSLLVWLST